MGRTRVEDDLPDDILASQWFPDNSDMGEKRLCWGVLHDAAYVLLGQLPKDPATRKSIKRQWEVDWCWIHSDDKSYTYSFVSVCDVLGLSPEMVRSRICGAIADKVCLPRRYWQLAGLVSRAA